MLSPNYYRQDVALTINGVVNGKESTILDPERTSKGNEVGSANYTEEGVPFIKTSNIINYDVDYEPDCFCPEYFVSQLGQGIKKGDIIFAKDGKPGEIAIIEEDSNVVISSGLVKYHPKDDMERYWIFLLLASKYGDAYFKKWFVIASTMLHLRQDFFGDFQIPEINDEVMADYIIPLKNAFEKKRTAYETIRVIKNKVEMSFTDENMDLTTV